MQPSQFCNYLHIVIFYSRVALMIDSLKKFYEMDFASQGPQYLEFRYHFARCKNISDFAVRMCNISPSHPVADEIKTHYPRSNLLLLGTRSENFSDLANYWMLSEDAQIYRQAFLERHAGMYNNVRRHRKISGSFQLMYHLFEMGILKSIILPSQTPDGFIAKHHPSPNFFQILLLSGLEGVNAHDKRKELIPPGLYSCRTHSAIVCPEGDFFQSMLELNGDTGKVLVPGHSVYSLCRKGEALIVAITLSGLPTYVLDFHRPDWSNDWQALTETVFVGGFKKPKERALALAQKCIKHWECPNYSMQNRWASWFFHPDFGTFPDEEIYDYFKRQIDS